MAVKELWMPQQYKTENWPAWLL